MGDRRHEFWADLWEHMLIVYEGDFKHVSSRLSHKFAVECCDHGIFYSRDCELESCTIEAVLCLNERVHEEGSVLFGLIQTIIRSKVKTQYLCSLPYIRCRMS